MQTTDDQELDADAGQRRAQEALETRKARTAGALRQYVGSLKETRRRADHRHRPAAWLVSCNRTLILGALDIGDQPENLASILHRTNPDIGEKEFLTAIKRLVSREAAVPGAPGTRPERALPDAPRAPGSDAQRAVTPVDASTPDTPHAPHSDAQRDAPAHMADDMKRAKGPTAATQTAPAAAPAVTNSAPGEQRYREKTPPWADGRYPDLECLQRHDGENDADYNWRMWHTPPPWQTHVLRSARDTDISYNRRCWSEGSPEERAAQQAALPPTAR